MFGLGKYAPMLSQGMSLMAIYGRLPGSDKEKLESIVSTVLPNLPLEGKWADIRDKFLATEGSVPGRLLGLAMDPEVQELLQQQPEPEGHTHVSAVKCRSCGFLQDIEIG